MSDTTVARVRNAYLEGNFGPVREEVTIVDLAVTGAVPDFLNGRYIRTGPNPITDPDPATYHWFLGTGMVHGVRLRDGRAEWYRNRYVRSADVATILGEPARPGPVPPAGDFASNTNVISQAGRTFVLVEGGRTRTSSHTTSTPSPGATSTARSRVPTHPTRCVTQTPASCTRFPTSPRGATGSSTPSWERTRGCAARSTSSAPARRPCTRSRSPRTMSSSTTFR